jgi:hypothetical protein
VYALRLRLSGRLPLTEFGIDDVVLLIDTTLHFGAAAREEADGC